MTNTKLQIVRFYRIVDQGNLPFRKPFPFEELQDVIEDLDDEHAYVRLSRMELLGSTYKPGFGVGSRRQVPLIALDRITRNPQIRIERRRQYRPLDLEEGENLADPAFYSVFDDGVIGIMRFGNASPGPASFRDYVNYLGIVEPPIEIAPLVDRNALRTLDDIGTLTKFDVRVLPDASEEPFSGSRLIFDSIRSTRQSMGNVTVEVSVKIATKQHEAAEEARRQIANIVTTDALAHTDKTEIRYRSIAEGRAVTHDFLSEIITMTVPVEIDDSTGQPAERSVSESMATAYDTQYEDLRSALHSSD